MIALAAVAVLTLGACGGADDDASDGVASLDDGTTDDTTAGTADPTATTEPVDQEEALLEYAACMREHGVDMPDPQVGENGEVMIQIGGDEPASGDGPPADIEEAMEECEGLMPRGPIERNGEKFDPTEMQDELLAFTQCMRDEGVDMPDPDFDADGRLESQTVDESADDEDGRRGPVLSGPFGTLDLSDPATEAAFEKCGEGTVFGPDGAVGAAGAAVGEPDDDQAEGDE